MLKFLPGEKFHHLLALVGKNFICKLILLSYVNAYIEDTATFTVLAKTKYSHNIITKVCHVASFGDHFSP